MFIHGTGLDVEARLVETTGPEIHCTEAPDPARTCAEIVEAVLKTLGPNHPPIARIDAPNICQGGLIPTCHRANWVTVTFAGPWRVQVRLLIRETPSGAFVEDPSAPEPRVFEPPYASVPSPGEGPWVWRAKLSGDRRTLSVEFFAPAEPAPCVGEYEPWVGSDGDNLVVKIVRVDRPIPSPTPRPTPPFAGMPRGIEVIACPMIGTLHRFEMTLPVPFTGATVRDLNGGIVVLMP